MKLPQIRKASLALLTLGALLLPVAGAHAAEGRSSFGFVSASIHGASSAEAFLSGGGAYVPQTGFIKTGGAFRCLGDVTKGPLAGCQAGEGVRWDAVMLLPSSGFNCGTPGEAAKTGVTSADTVVILADFYRRGDGVEESFTGKMIVSANDIAPDVAGAQHVWIQGVGCGDAIVNFN